jgi:hypothetical protein
MTELWKRAILNPGDLFVSGDTAAEQGLEGETP